MNVMMLNVTFWEIRDSKTSYRSLHPKITNVCEHYTQKNMSKAQKTTGTTNARWDGVAFAGWAAVEHTLDTLDKDRLPVLIIGRNRTNDLTVAGITVRIREAKRAEKNIL